MRGHITEGGQYTVDTAKCIAALREEGFIATRPVAVAAALRIITEANEGHPGADEDDMDALGLVLGEAYIALTDILAT